MSGPSPQDGSPVTGSGPRSDGRPLHDGELRGDGREPDTAIQQFLDVVAHEVRTPLSIARAAAATLASGHYDGPEREPLLAMTLRNTDLALLLLDRMRLAREVEAGAVALTRESIDLSALLHETLDDLRESVLGRHPVQATAPRGAMVYADGTALREILLNLLLNAAKYSPPDTPIEVALVGDDSMVELEIRDHGAGIPPAELDHIFHKYVRGQMGSGVGLGLFISRGLARAHGGELLARPDVREGSAFVLRLPRRPVTAAR